MSVESLVLHPHLVVEEPELPQSLLHVAVEGKGRNAHKHVVEPNGVFHRSESCKLSVGVSVFLVGNEVVVASSLFVPESEVLYSLGICCLCLEHGATDGTAVVEGIRRDHLFHQRVNLLSLFFHFYKPRSLFGEEAHAIHGIVGIARVAGYLCCTEHGGISHAPLVGSESEVASS